jgi:phosphoglycolate phosphatase-like HAD superfamily hydrolase
MKAVLFDVEGTLIDCTQQTIDAWRRTLARSGHFLSEAELQRQSGRDANEMLALLLPNSTKAFRKKLQTAESELYRSEYLPTVRAFRGVRALFEKAKGLGCKLALATTCQADELARYLDLLDITDLLDGTACGSEVERGKPYPDLFRFALEKIGCDAGSAVAVGDSPYDAQAAQAAGIRAVGVATGGFSQVELRSAGHSGVFADLEDLARHWEA